MPSSNKGVVTILLRNAENQRLRDIRTLVEFYRSDGQKLQGFVRNFENHREDFELDAFPMTPKHVEVKPVRYTRVATFLCAEHVRQLGGESPLDNLMEVKS
jgi:hypothetical protein